MSARDALAAIRERAEAATEGPWKLWGMSVMADPVGNSDLDDAIDVASTHMAIDGKPRTFDAEFIAHARTDVPVLVEIAQALEGYVSDLDEGEPMNADDVDTLRQMLTALDPR